ncbi:MAG TPA: hypothetical protein VN920_16895 [Pyrinomonadaceae bacterium]|nr:hypothetical protein [Pyrinomonadaceae bacterium]
MLNAEHFAGERDRFDSTSRCDRPENARIFEQELEDADETDEVEREKYGGTDQEEEDPDETDDVEEEKKRQDRLGP